MTILVDAPLLASCTRRKEENSKTEIAAWKPAVSCVWVCSEEACSYVLPRNVFVLILVFEITLTKCWYYLKLRRDTLFLR